MINCFYKIITHVTDGKDFEEMTFDQLKEYIKANVPNTLHKLRNFAILIDNQRYESERMKSIKQAFLDVSQSTKDVDEPAELDALKEVLCESFCLIDIKRDIASLDTSTFNYESARQSVDPSTFGSPGNLVSPISQRPHFDEADTSAQ